MKATVQIEVTDSKTVEEIGRMMRIIIRGWSIPDEALSNFDSVDSLKINGQEINLENGTSVLKQGTAA